MPHRPRPVAETSAYGSVSLFVVLREVDYTPAQFGLTRVLQHKEHDDAW